MHQGLVFSSSGDKLHRMLLRFIKMNGAGNDFVLIDNRAQQIRLAREQVARLCHRQRGIGADGLVLLVPCASGQAEWAWEFYNSDGSTANMCGNAARCSARFVQRLTGAKGRIRFETGAGVITTELHEERVTVTLTPPKDLRVCQELKLSVGLQQVHSVNTGVPHAVLFVLDADLAPVQQLGPEVRWHAQFAPQGANVNFVQVLGQDSIRVRTYERGVEGETLACGTGVTAAALISARIHRMVSPVKVRVQSGDVLEVRFRQVSGRFAEVQLNGPAEFVFEGEIEL
jgi:diaminopimelate epimerase